MIQENCKILVLSLIFVATGASGLQGFEVQTHTKLSEKATDSSRLNEFLTTALGFEFPQGTGEEIGQGEFKTVRQLIADVGAVNEDKPDIRSRTHFHDPTKAWAQAGLSWPLGTSQSSILWSQNPNQGSTGKHSWQDARNSYFDALTATDPAERKRFYAETFESLGHLIHLVQDAATPAHTRNDWHLGLTTGNSVFPFLNVDRFHQWAKLSGVGAISSAASQPFDPSILNQTYDGLVPIAGIIDTTNAAGPATPSEATNIGIAEFSNANFFSDDTILKDYAFPNTTQMDLTEEPGPDGPEPRSYLKKNYGPGPIGYRAAVSSRLSGFLPFGFATQQWELDDNVMADYGALLFPRAIGYSAGLIDYFFAGSVDAVGLVWPENATSIRLTSIGSTIYPGAPRQPSGTGTIVLVLVTCPLESSNCTYYVSQPKTITIVPSNVGDPNPNNVEADMGFSGLPGSSSGSFWAGLVWQGPVAELGQGETIIIEQQGVVVSPIGFCCN